jgi:ribosome-binding factor A
VLPALNAVIVVMQSRRLERVRELLKRELSTLLLREFPVAQAGVLSVNEVKLAGDLQSAIVYVGVVGTEQQRQKTIPLLNEKRTFIQALLGNAVVLRHTPVLRFVLDDSVERGNRVLHLIEEIEKTLPPQQP